MQFFTHGFYPSSWKAAQVFALHKGGFALHKGGFSSDANNFRPISILSVTSKILEKHVHDSFYQYQPMIFFVILSLVLGKIILVLLV